MTQPVLFASLSPPVHPSIFNPSHRSPQAGRRSSSLGNLPLIADWRNFAESWLCMDRDALSKLTPST